MQSESIGKLAEALAKAQGEIANIKKSKTADTGKFSYDYADIADGLAAVRPVLSKNGLAFSQATRIEGAAMVLVTKLLHSSGEWLAGEYPVCSLNGNHQAMGSALTYARRYSLFAMVGVAAENEDDDGKTAEKPAAPHRQAARRPPVDELPHTEPKEAAPGSSKPDAHTDDNAPVAPASVSAGSSPIRPPSRVDAIPTVEPTKPKPLSWKERERIQFSKGATDALLGGVDGKGGLVFIRAAVGISKVEIVETQFGEWRKRADQAWKRIVDEDKERITVAVREFKDALEAEMVTLAGISKGDDWDRETGELREAAE